MRPNGHKHDPPVNTVILQHAFREWWTIGGAAADHAVQSIDTDKLVLEGIAWVRAPDMGTAGAPQPLRVIDVVEKVVIVGWILPQRGVIAVQR